MSRRRFEAYLDKVFDFSQFVGALPEGRQSPRHPWQKVFDAVFLGAAMQIPSLLQIQAECRSGALAQRVGPISDDTIGYALQRQSPDPVFALGCQIARRLKRNGIFRSDWSRGLVVAAVDGIEICSSFTRCCDACMQREVPHKVRGEMRTDLQYCHRMVAVVCVSTPFPVPLGIRFQIPGPPGRRCVVSPSALRPSSRTFGFGLGLHLATESAGITASWARFPQRSSINSAAVGGASMPRCFRPLPPTATSNIPPSTKARPW